MLNFCTVADSNYLLKGLAMYQSLKQHTVSEFKLHWLCIDQQAYDDLLSIRKVNESYYSQLKIYNLGVYEYGNPELKQARNNPKSNYGDEYSQYCWCLAPWFTNYILQRIPSNHFLTYVDSDIFFYNSPYHIVNTVIQKNKSIGIHTHRFAGEFKEQDNGWYNVGIVVFRNNEAGLNMSNLWKEWLLNPTNKYHQKYGTCGDQKYLELFPKLAPDDVCVFDVEGDILHYAPWCTHNPKNQEPLFFHFSHFNFYNHTDNLTWSDSNAGEWNPSADPQIHNYYEQYFQRILTIYGTIQLSKLKNA